MTYEIKKTSSFKNALKKIKRKDILDQIEVVIDKLANDEILEKRYKDHALKGEFKGYRECHIKPDLLLIYKKLEERLILVCVDLGSHSELF